jgi:hypothetical protein
MRIIDLEDPLKRIVEVYAIYWVDGMRSHLVIPYEGYNGLIIVRENKCEVVDPSINGFILKKGDYGRDILIHWAAEKDGLIYSLADGAAPDEIAELHRRIREDKPPF